MESVPDLCTALLPPIEWFGGLVKVIKKLVTDNSEFMDIIMSFKLKSKLCRSNYFDLKTFSFS